MKHMKRFSLTRLVQDRGGNFGIMTAIVLPIAIGFAGVAIDVTSAIQMKSQLQGIADSAALAAASNMASKNMSEADAKELAEDFLASQLMSDVRTQNETPEEAAAREKAIRDAASVSVKQATTPSGKSYDVKLTTSYDMPLNAMTRLVAGNSFKLGITSAAKSTSVSDTAISMYLALDRSGSMSFVTTEKNPLQSVCANYKSDSWPDPYSYYPCYIRKIQALQTAASALFNSLNKADPKMDLVRVGAVSYNDDNQTEQALTWGTTLAATYVNHLPALPTGGTDASGAMDIAFKALKTSNIVEASAHAGKGHTNFQRYILLMTDGEMTGNSANWNNGLDQKTRNICRKAKDDGIIIFSVAFMAPTKGKELLSYCATDTSNYYEPDDMTDLVKAFGEIAEKAAKTTTRLTN